MVICHRKIGNGLTYDRLQSKAAGCPGGQGSHSGEVGKILNKSQQGYNHIEAGRAELKIDDLVKLCQFYNLTADYLVGLSDQPQKIK